MNALRFDSEHALRFAITSSLVPPEVVASPARAWHDGPAALIVSPLVPLAPEVVEQLVRAGVRETDRASPGGPAAARAVRSWAEIVPAEPTRDVAGNFDRVLFLVPEDGSLLELAGELVRLGCDRLAWRALAGGEFLLRAGSPPFFSILRALEGTGARGPCAYVPAPPGQDRVYVEVGFAHVLARFLAPDAGHTLLVSGRRPDGGEPAFRCVPDGPFVDIYASMDIRVPATPALAEAEETELPRLRVTLRLARSAATANAQLWVLREDAVARVEALLASLPEEATNAFLFAAATRGGDELIVLRARPGARTSLDVDGETYRSHPAVANLFLPCDATLEPPLRRETLRERFIPDEDRVVWLRRDGGDAFAIESLPEDAFLPLSDWVEYVVDRSAPQLLPWVRSATFAFEEFVGEGSPRAHAAPAERPETRARARPRSSESLAVAQATAPEVFSRPTPGEAPVVAVEERPPGDTEVVAALEREFLSLDVSADHPTRRALLERMAPLYAALGRRQDAALAWARVVWDVPGDASRSARSRWANSEQAATGPSAPRALLGLGDPTPDEVRTLAALFVADRPEVTELVHDATRWLDQHDGGLDSRTAWLARVALSRLVGGDRLGLCRARDRILRRMHRGLSVQREVPSFLRHADAGRDAVQIELLASKLDALLARFETTKRKRSATEADPVLTGAYVRLVFAYAAARLGRRERAEALRDTALASLPGGDPVHDYLGQAFSARVAQALEAMPAEIPLPAELARHLDALDELERYKVDRVRRSSTVLEPHERLDPFDAFQRGEADPRGPEFAGLRGEEDDTAVARGVAEIVATAMASRGAERARLFDGVMDFFPGLSHERATAHLLTVVEGMDDVAPPRRAQLLEKALMLAGHLGEEQLARRTFAALEPLVARITADDPTAVAPLLGGIFRTLRRVGLRDEATQLLATVRAATSGAGVSRLVARLHAAAGLAYLDDLEAATRIIEEALDALGGAMTTSERLVATRATARALAATPLAFAVAGLERLGEQLEVITDTFNTNTHVCVSVLDFMEAIVLGYASDDLALGQAARRWLDEDEHLIRQRIFRDLQERAR